MDVLLRGGKLVTPQGVCPSDLLIRGEKIEAIGPDLEAGYAELIDVTGMLLLPGGIDVHTHLELKTPTANSSDDWYTGTAAAAYGGTTTVVDHPSFGPAGCSVFHQIDAYHELASSKAIIDYSFHGVIQHVDEQVVHDIEELVSRGIVSSKVYLTYDHALSDGEIIRFLESMKHAGGLTAFHCENDGVVKHYRRAFQAAGKTLPIYHAKSRPHTAEAEAVARVIRLAETVGDAPVYIVHLSTASGLEEIRRGRERGLPIFAETCPQYLLLDETRYNEPGDEGLKYILSPPLRTRADIESLWEGVADGAIQTIGTDHAPFTFEVKRNLSSGGFLSCPNGMPGIEARLMLLYTAGVAAGRISLERFVEVVSTLPAKIMGLYPRKGVLCRGSDADIVVLDPQKRVTLTHAMLHERVDYTPYEGIELAGFPVLTIRRGEIIVDGGELRAHAGSGRFIKRKTPNLAGLEISR